jgi:uncharacterized membrane protein YoaK (UPF0700 family)
MFSKLPRWVEVGGFCLAFLAGAANAIGLLGFDHEAVSHLTGTTTLLGVSLTNQTYTQAAHLVGILVAFVVGAAASGAIVGRVALQLGQRYGFALLLEAGLFFAAMAALLGGSTTGHYLASAACGLQNGMVSTYSGAVVRTTHVSGMFTDLGTMLGGRLRGHAANPRQVKLYLLLIAGFLLGGVSGAWLFARIGFVAFALPGGGALLLAAAYWLLVDRQSATPQPRLDA